MSYGEVKDKIIKILDHYPILKKKVEKLKKAVNRENFEKKYWHDRVKYYAPGNMEEHYKDLHDSLVKEGYYNEEGEGDEGWIRVDTRKPNSHKIDFKTEDGLIWQGNYGKFGGAFYAYGVNPEITGVTHWRPQTKISPLEEIEKTQLQTWNDLQQ